MKKIALSVVFIVGFASYGFATNKIAVKTTDQQDPKSAKEEKAEKYDFSLFKFIRSTPAVKKEENDTTKQNTKGKNFDALKDETTDNYEKPRDFFKLSYAS